MSQENVEIVRRFVLSVRNRFETGVWADTDTGPNPLYDGPPGR